MILGIPGHRRGMQSPGRWQGQSGLTEKFQHQAHKYFYKDMPVREI